MVSKGLSAFGGGVRGGKAPSITALPPPGGRGGTCPQERRTAEESGGDGRLRAGQKVQETEAMNRPSQTFSPPHSDWLMSVPYQPAETDTPRAIGRVT